MKSAICGEIMQSAEKFTYDPTPSVIDSKIRIAHRASKDRKRISSANSMGPTDHQERHSPTEPVMVRIATRIEGDSRIAVTKERSRCRVDDRVWSDMTVEQEKASDQIAMAWHLICGEIQIKTMKYEPPTSRGKPGMGGGESMEYRILENYFTWSRELPKNKMSFHAISDIMFEGKTFRQTDADYRHRHGWARNNLLTALDLYAEISGL